MITALTITILLICCLCHCDIKGIFLFVILQDTTMCHCSPWMETFFPQLGFSFTSWFWMLNNTHNDASFILYLRWYRVTIFNSADVLRGKCLDSEAARVILVGREIVGIQHPFWSCNIMVSHLILYLFFVLFTICKMLYILVCQMDYLLQMCILNITIHECQSLDLNITVFRYTDFSNYKSILCSISRCMCF